MFRKTTLRETQPDDCEKHSRPFREESRPASLNSLNWEKIDFIESKGASDEVNRYAYTHLKPHSGLNYYRLKQIDFDGNFEYSEIKSVIFSNDVLVSVYPNPAKDKLTIRTSIQEDVAIQLSNINGQVLYEGVKGSVSSIDLSSFAQGMYFLTVTHTELYHVIYRGRIVKK